MSTRTRAFLVVSLALAALGFGMPGFSGATYSATSTSTGSVGAASDWTPPTVAVTSPGAVVSGTTTVTATASDADSGVASVQLQYATTGSSTWTALCAARTIAPYTCSWDTTALTDGDYDLRATATDDAGYSATSAVVTTTVRNTATVTLTPVSDNVRGAVPLSATITGQGNQAITTFRLEYADTGGNSWTTICSGTSATLSCSWNTAGLNKDVDVRAYAVVGGKTYTDLEENVTLDNTAPSVSITSPAKSSTVSGTITVATNATDAGSGVDTVVVQYAPTGTSTWTTACTADLSPWSCRFDTTAVADKVYDLRAVATDLAGNSIASQTVTAVTVSNTQPTVSIESPTAGSYVSGTVSVRANAAASTATVTKVSIQARTGTNAFAEVCSSTASPWTCSWNTAGLNGSYDLRAVLTDSLNRTATSSTVTVNVDNSALRAYDVQTTNSGTAGRLNAGDKISLTYSSQVNLSTILAGWSGSATTVSAKVTDGQSLGLTDADDTFSVTGVNLGSVNLRANLVKKRKTATMATSTMVASTTTVNGVTATVVTITLGQPTGMLTTSTKSVAMLWTPSATAKTPGGTASSTAPATEGGAADVDF